MSALDDAAAPPPAGADVSAPEPSAAPAPAADEPKDDAPAGAAQEEAPKDAASPEEGKDAASPEEGASPSPAPAPAAAADPADAKDDATEDEGSKSPMKRPRPAASEADGLDGVLCRYPLAHGALLCSRGSVLDFEGGAIVNAANEGCQGGGGVDGAITSAGGAALAAKRSALPAIDADGYRRCATGDAVATPGGPFGRLACDVVIHAVGPNYHCLPDGDDDDGDDLARGDALLAGAYEASMKRAAENGCKTLAFSLLSAGIFRGAQSLDKILEVSVAAVAGAAYPGLERVHLVAFTRSEQVRLAAAAKNLLDPAARAEAEAAAAAGPPPLPPGWKEFASDSGRPYFHHKASGATQWKRPTQD